VRKAAGIIMLVFGIFTIAGGLIVLRPGIGGMAHVWVGIALAALLVAGGISALRRKAYWWALLAAIAMVLYGVSNAVWAWQDPWFQHRYDTATRLLMAAGTWAIWGIPGLVALIFLVKRKGEFTGTEVKQAAKEEE
jgi:hypothetical protein